MWMRLCASAARRPGAPPTSKNCAIDAANPMHTVATSQRNACIVS